MSSRFSASNVERLSACPGSAHLELSIPGWVPPVVDPTKGAKGLGTKVHDLLQTTSAWPLSWLSEMADAVEQLALVHYIKRREALASVAAVDNWMTLAAGPNHDTARDLKVWLTSLQEFAPAQLRFIAEALAYMFDLRINLAPDVEVIAEKPIVADWLQTKPGTTPDVVLLSLNHLQIVDYKTGKIMVFPQFNPQLLYYAACYLEYALDVEEITVHIVQPGNMGSWTITREKLLEWMDQMRAAEQKVIDKDTTLVAGEHCKFCPANPHSRGDKGRPLCPVMLRLLYPEPALDEDALLS